MKVRLTTDTYVRLKKGMVVEVEASEGGRLIALKTAEPAVEAPKEEKKAKKKAGK